MPKAKTHQSEGKMIALCRCGHSANKLVLRWHTQEGRVHGPGAGTQGRGRDGRMTRRFLRRQERQGRKGCQERQGRPGCQERQDARNAKGARMPGTPGRQDARNAKGARMPGTPRAPGCQERQDARMPGTPGCQERQGRQECQERQGLPRMPGTPGARMPGRQDARNARTPGTPRAPGCQSQPFCCKIVIAWHHESGDRPRMPITNSRTSPACPGVFCLCASRMRAFVTLFVKDFLCSQTTAF